MPAGLEVYDGNGQLVLSLTDRISRVLGEFSIPPTINSGSVTLPEFTGNLFVHVLNIETHFESLVAMVKKSEVTISISGNTLSWTRRLTGFGTPEYPIKVVYGAY